MVQFMSTLWCQQFMGSASTKTTSRRDWVEIEIGHGMIPNELGNEQHFTVIYAQCAMVCFAKFSHLVAIWGAMGACAKFIGI